jgi:hypothetical protein
MPQARTLVLMVLFLAGGPLGCAANRYGCADDECSGEAGATVPTPGQPGPVAIDLSAVPTFEAFPKTAAEAAVPQQYRILNAQQCQCLAAANSTLGNLLAEESQAMFSAHPCGHGKPVSSSSLQANLLAYRSVDERNRSAGAALECFYLLAETEFNRSVLDRGLARIDQSIKELEQARDSGLAVPVDESVLGRQRLDLLDQKTQLEGSAAQLQARLARLLGLPHETSQPLWAAADFAVTVVPIDVDEAVRQGLANRADLGMLSMLREHLSIGNLGAVRAGLGVLDPMLGSPSPAGCGLGLLLHHAGDSQELATREAQLDRAVSDQCRAAEEEIRQAVSNVELRLRQIAVGKEKLEGCREHLDRLRQQAKADGAMLPEITSADLETMRAESDAVHRVAAWRIAEAKLKQAQGLLAPECGYPLPQSCSGSCGSP